MRFGFKKETSLTTLLPITEDFIINILTDILNDYDMMYTHTISKNGFCLKPKFNVSFRKNSFWPEVTGEFSKQDSQTDIHISCRPVKLICYFFYLFTLFSLFIEVVCVITAFTNGFANIFPLLIPLFLCIFAYLLVSIGSTVCSNRIIRIIKKAIK